ncbi:golgin subfamily A member 6-like protein 1 [Cynoglossus semilaevis]|uniref:golgin subfamily A member 6-like protein 1 n=1 Tax=Cynoglossus semilaevis TaxID=244447 RepID=UPI000496AFD8|nr:golgin subfamily A member 6-like protein 1 [Cynoglossus semilaevis]
MKGRKPEEIKGGVGDLFSQALLRNFPAKQAMKQRIPRLCCTQPEPVPVEEPEPLPVRQLTPPPPWKNTVSQKKAKANRRTLYDPEKARMIASQPMLVRLAEDNDIRQIDYAIRETKCDAVREEQILKNAELRESVGKGCDFDFDDPNGINRKFWDTIDKREKVRNDFLEKERKNIRKQYGHIIELKKLRELKKKLDKESMSKVDELNKEHDRKANEKKKEAQQRLMERITQQNSKIMETKKKQEEEQKIMDMRAMEINRHYQQLKDENERKWRQRHVEREKMRQARYDSTVVDLNMRTQAEQGRKEIWKADPNAVKFGRIEEHKDKVLQEIKEVGIPDKLIYGASRKSNIIIKKAKSSDPSLAPSAIRVNILAWE